jgi:hypothetical protein
VDCKREGMRKESEEKKRGKDFHKHNLKRRLKLRFYHQIREIDCIDHPAYKSDLE